MSWNSVRRYFSQEKRKKQLKILSKSTSLGALIIFMCSVLEFYLSPSEFFTLKHIALNIYIIAVLLI